MRSINELGLDLEKVEVRKKVVNFLMGVNVEFKHPTLDYVDCKGKIIGYRNNHELPDFYLIILAVGGAYSFGWQSLDEFDTVVYSADMEARKTFALLAYIQISDILADTLVMFVKGKTISGPKVFKDWKVSMSYLSNSNGFKY